MKIRKRFEWTRFGVDTIKTATELLSEMNTVATEEDRMTFTDDPMWEQLKDMTSWEHEPVTDYSITDKDGLEWELDTLDEWLEAYQLGATSGYLSQYKSVYRAGIRLDFDFAYSQGGSAAFEPHAIVAVDGRDRETAFSLMRPFNISADVGVMPKPVEASPPIKVFIGHGRAADWRELSEELHHVHKYEVEAFEYGSRAGLQITDIVESMVASSSFAVLILNPDDEQADGQRRARQNVIHELGLCQGRLGFRRVIPVIESGVEGISNLAGTKAIPYAPGTIKGTVSEILASLRREFPDHK